MKFKVSETYACWTTSTRIIEAENAAEALSLFNEGEGVPDEGSPEFGDRLEYIDSSYDVATIKE